jgi:hypothetical protein
MIITEDFLPKDQFDKLQAIVMDRMFPWYYISHVSMLPGSKEINDPLAIETDGWYHNIYETITSTHSYSYDYFIPFFQHLSDVFGYKREQMIRARLSMKTPKVGFTEDNYNMPHIDDSEPHTTLIFYMNESDGDTRIFDQKYTVLSQPSIFTTQARVTPKENRLLSIDGLQYHTASNPFNTNRRIVLNINIIH